MIARWNQGRAEVDRLIAEGRVDRVSASRDLADLMIAQSRAHLLSASALLATDVTGAFQLAYDGARKALAAILANEGLRTKGAGAHATLLEVVMAQLHPPLGPTFESFDWMRRLRNTTEYPDAEKPIAEAADVTDAIAAATRIVDAAEQMPPNMPVY
jgi:hypothetical protein